MEEKVIVAFCGPRSSSGETVGELREFSSGGRREFAYDNNPFLIHVSVQSGLQGVKSKVPFPQFLFKHGREPPLQVFTCSGETSENVGELRF